MVRSMTTLAGPLGNVLDIMPQDRQVTIGQSFEASFQAYHPSRDLKALGIALKLKPFRLWRAGDKRVTPAGTMLNGVYDQSYICIRIPVRRSDSPSEAITKFSNRLVSARTEVMMSDLRVSGGKFRLFISPDALQDEFDSSLLSRLGTLGVSLGFDYRPTES